MQSESTKEFEEEEKTISEEFCCMLGMFDFVRIHFINFLRATQPPLKVCCRLKRQEADRNLGVYQKELQAKKA